MITVPVYRPEITVHHRGPDGEWGSTFGTQTNTLFYPMADEDRVPTSAGFLRTVCHGDAPAFTVEAPDGSTLVPRGSTFLLRTPDGKLHDAINALIFAKRGAFGLDLVRDRPIPPAPPRKPAARRQLSLFEDGGAS